MSCQWCEGPLWGRQRKYCSDRCRKAAHGDREALKAIEERADFIRACIVEGRWSCRRGM